jgi:peptidoglycan/xylan/chitin deacetylase (PgdA/CDA1 family)
MTRRGDWLAPLRRELDAAPRPCTFFFRDDDAGWADEQLVELLDLFAHHAVPVDVAVIPAALDAPLAARLRRRRDLNPELFALHQHGFSHTNHECTGRPCEFGAARPVQAQRRDIAMGALRLSELLGELPPIFTPPWNRCTEATGRSLLALGFQMLVRDFGAAPLDLSGLQELNVNVDWPLRRSGQQLALGYAGDAIAALCRRDVVGVMLHHALLGPTERKHLEELVALLGQHENAECVLLSALLHHPPPRRVSPIRPPDAVPLKMGPPGLEPGTNRL